ncbi:2-polyprenyl-6-methoxyphenol hydroxylase [Halogranum rubrum]|uniref:2-polyprenyl-6-methoxyphenol hydroxylase n=1 Tax=Halogranum rubrum TaxID=553466 RepID=A0A1I4H5G5_9EURY|nr:FAD-dependent monooxygenase [Halogranum rubrum]SFL37504.1 2-polyprenyl-6-methoxyphenol hydroxylase [Halogranum rubrum]
MERASANTTAGESNRSRTDGGATTEQTPSDSTRELAVDVVVVGAGPGGCVLSYLLARSGVEVALLERHADLDREFRGFGFQPDVLRLFDGMGLLKEVLDLDHERIETGELYIYGDPCEIFDFDDVPGPYNYGILMEQPPLLELLIEEASAYENFTYYPSTPVRDLVVEGGQAVGVDATDRVADEDLTIRSRLVVGADGRFSTVRKAAGIDPGLLDSDIELLWFKLPDTVAHSAAQSRLNEHGLLLYFGLGGGEVQLGWFVESGTYPDLRAEGIESFRKRLAAVDPSLSAAFPGALPDFEHCSLLHIAPGLSTTWVDDGLLLLGDAAHVASPVGAQGNALAIQDAVVAHATVMNALDRERGRDTPLPEELLRRYVDRRRPDVKRVMRAQRRGEKMLSLYVRHGDAVPEAVKRPLLKAMFGVASKVPFARTRVGQKLVETFMFGPDPVTVDTTWFTD